MISHVSINVRDLEKGKNFYTKAFAPLGYKMNADYPDHKVAGFGETKNSDLWVAAGGDFATSHIAFAAKDKAQVDGFYKAGLDAGGTDNGKPGYRKDYSPGYYAAFVHDIDGNNVEVVFHDPNPSA